MIRLLFLFAISFSLQTISWAQCPSGSNIDNDGDGVLDCIDPCPNNPTSVIGNLSFESDFVGWTIPQNQNSFSISENTNHTLHDDKSLVVAAPNATNFENHAIYSNEFILKEGVSYNFKIPVKRIGNLDGDALRWVLIDENGLYRHFNNHYSFTEDWTYISYENFLVDFSNFSSNKFRLRLEFGLSTTDMVVDKIEFYETALGDDPAYADYDADGIPDCSVIDVSNHPDYDVLVTFYNSLGGQNWTNNTNWLDTTKPLSSWYGITEINGRVTHINLGQNNLNGMLPENIGDLTYLYYLQLNTNNITGTIPKSITNLSNLFTLILGVNNITGGIPPEIGNMISLTYLHLGVNPLKGTIPESLENLINLTHLDLRACQLTGEIPSGLGKLTKLNSLFLFLNDLSGEVPQSLQNLTNLINLQFSDNNLSGKIPDFTGLTNLAYFNISNNNFQFGDFEDEFTAYKTNLENFIYKPQRAISLFIENKLLEIGDNLSLSALPISGGNNLYQWYFNGQPLDVNTNTNMSGITSNNLQITNINSSQLGIYQCIVTNSVVSELSFIGSTFQVGLTPTSHPDYDTLVTLYNSLNGDNWLNNTNWLDTTKPISSWHGITETNGRVTSIVLDNNNLFGNIPAELTNLTELETFWITNSNLSGEIPANIGDLSKLRQLVLFYTQGLTGSIPESVKNCSNLEWLYVTTNQLEGPIPDLTELPNLSVLSIDNNNFEFGDFETKFSNYQNLLGNNFIFSPQNNVGEFYTEAIEVGNSTSFSVNVSGSQNSYNWYRINADGSDGNFVASGENINVTINTTDDYKWYYYYEASSNLVPGLILRSEFFKIGDLPTNHPDYDALIAIYNAFDGANWTIPWDITKPINDWSFNIKFDSVSNRVTELHISDNGSGSVKGTIPPEIGDLTELTVLNCFVQDISGEIPLELWNLTKLKSLFLGAQESKKLLLSNGIPPEIANLQDLEWLNLTHIPLSQPLQPELFNLPKLMRLRIVECGLTGSLPKELAQISDVLASGNEFEGPIPQEFLDAVGNTNLSIANNYFNFADLEPLVQANNYTTISYSPQRTKDIAQNLTFAPGSDIVLNIDDTSLNKANSSKGTGDEYQWYKDNVAINGANAISYTIVSAKESDSGVYYCEITNNLLPDLTINRANITILIDASLSNEKLVIDDINVYPNPTKNLLNVKLTEFNKAEASLYDISGRLVLKQKLESKISKININNLISGMYLLQIKTENKSITKRIIKQ